LTYVKSFNHAGNHDTVMTQHCLFGLIHGRSNIANLRGQRPNLAQAPSGAILDALDLSFVCMEGCPSLHA